MNIDFLKKILLLMFTVALLYFVLYVFIQSKIDYTDKSTVLLINNNEEISLYKSLQVGQTKVIYPKYIKENQLKTLQEIVEKNFNTEKYVAVRWTEANFNGDTYPDAVFMIYSDLGKEKIDRSWYYSIDHPNFNANPGRLLSVNNFDLVSTKKGCAFIVLGNENSSIVSSNKCLDEYNKDEYYFYYFNYGSLETDVQAIDLNDDGVDDLIRIGMSIDDYGSSDRHYLSAIFQGFSSKYELTDLKSTDDSERYSMSEETQDYMFARVADTFEDKGLYKYNKHGFVYYKEETILRDGDQESCEVNSWKWLHGNVFEYSKKESKRATRSACVTNSNFLDHGSLYESMIRSDMYNNLVEKEVDLNGKKYEAVGTEDSFVKNDGFLIKNIIGHEAKSNPRIKKCFRSLSVNYYPDEDNDCMYGEGDDFMNYIFLVFKKIGF